MKMMTTGQMILKDIHAHSTSAYQISHEYISLVQGTLVGLHSKMSSYIINECRCV